MTSTNMNIKEHMEVVGSDGQHVGTVDKVEGDRIKLTRDDSSDGKHHFISTDNVDSVEQDKVMLSHSADEARSNWEDDEMQSSDTQQTGSSSSAASQRSA